MALDTADILDLVDESIVVRDRDGRILTWNRAAEALYGIAGGQAVGRPIADVLRTEYPLPLAEIEQALRTGGRWEGEVKRRIAGGQDAVIHVRLAARRDPAGQIASVVETGRDITQQKRDAATLAYNEHRYHNLFRAMAASFWELDFSAVDSMLRALRKSGVEDFRRYFRENPAFVRDMMRATRVIDVNDQTVALFGLGEKEKLLGSVEPFWPEESTQAYADGILAGAMGKPHYTVECKLRRVDGSTFDGLFTSTYPPMTMGKGTLLVGVVDITARKQAYVELEQSERRYRNLFNYMPVALTQIDASAAGPILEGLRAKGITDLGAYFEEHPDFIWELSDQLIAEEANEHLVRLAGGRTPADVIGPITRWWRARPDTLMRSMVARFRGEEFFQEETQIVRLDGSLLEVLFSTARPSTVGGKGIVGFIDITQRKQAFAELQQSERRYRDLFDYMPISLTQVDAKKLIPMFKELRAQGVTDLTAYIDEHPAFLRRAVDALEVEEVNQHNVRMFGADNAAEMLGPITRYWESGLRTIRRSIEARYRGEDFFSEETKVTRMDGSVIDVLFATARPGAVADKSLVGFIEITDRKKSEEALRVSEYRYRNMFQAMAASFWELDFSPANDMVREVLKGGVKDLRRYFADHPGFVRDMMRSTHVVDVNEQTVALFGKGAKGPLLGNVEPFWPEESTAIYAEAYLSAVERKPNYSAECKLRRIDGTMFDALFTVAYPPASLGIGTTMVGVIDISARKQSEAALRASEQRYQNLFQAMAVSFWELDFSGVNSLLRGLRASGVIDFKRYFAENPHIIRQVMAATRVVDVNDRTVALFGRGDKSELLATTEPFWPEESWPDYAEAMLSSIEHDLRFSIDTRLRRLDGTVFDAQFTVWYSAEDKTKGLAGVLDITERKRAFQALEQSEQRYRILFDHMPIPLWRMNSTRLTALFGELRAQGVTDLGDYIERNPALLGQAMDAITVEEVNRSTVELFEAEDASELLGSVVPYWRADPMAFRRILAARFRGEEIWSEETRMTGRRGRIREGTFTAAFPPALTELGISLNGFVDSTERNRAQARLRQVEADFAHAARVSMLGELTASIAHEVNQPLAAIATNGEAGLRWLGRAEPDVGEARELIKRIVADARRAASVISRIRAMATRGTPEQAIISVDDVVREALGFLRHEVQSRGVSVVHYPARTSPGVLGDRTQLQQVVVNLAVNAMQAMNQAAQKSRRIGIRTELQADGHVACAVEDSGPGIDPQNLARMFESFFTTKDGGMGMGLPICRSIIEAHGGRIVADNASTLGGARFAFVLPAAP